MIVSVTTLGSATGNAAGAAADVVKYLEGRSPVDRGRDPGPTPDLPAADKTTGAVGYYADSMAAPGIWMGSGLTGVRMEGMIDPKHLHAVLLGQNPLTGRPTHHRQRIGAAGPRRAGQGRAART